MRSRLILQVLPCSRLCLHIHLLVHLIGNIYISDSYNNRVRKVTASIITLLAGTGTASYSGDNGPATSAACYFPVGVAVDASGNF